MYEKIFDEAKCWYVILVRMGKEQTIKQHILKALNVEDIVIPEIIKKTKNEEFNSRHEIFLGYIFLKLSLNVENYYQLLEIDSVFKFLGQIKPVNDNLKVYFPHKIPENQINNVKRFLSVDSIDEIVENKIKFNIGDIVEIISGDLSSVYGKISHLSGNYAYITSQKFFTQTIKVPIQRIAHYSTES